MYHTVFTEVASHLSGNLHLICSQAVQFSGKKIIENVTVKNYWKERFVVYFVLWKRFFRKEFNLELKNIFICISYGL